MAEAEVKVTVITTDEMEVYISDERTLEILIEALKASARLDYTGNGLTFDFSELAPVVRAVLPETYNRLLTKLKKEKEEQE